MLQGKIHPARKLRIAGLFHAWTALSLASLLNCSIWTISILHECLLLQVREIQYLYHLICLNWHACVCIHVCAWKGNTLEGEVMQFAFNQYRGQGEGRREKDVLIPKGEYTSSTELSVSSLRSTDEKCSSSAFSLVLPLVKPPHWQGWGRKVMLPVQHDLFPLL